MFLCTSPHKNWLRSGRSITLPRPLRNPPQKIGDDPFLTRFAETIIVAPKYRRNLPCSIESYCSREDCKKRVSGVWENECLIDNHCKKRGCYYESDDIPLSFCIDKKCQYLLQSNKGSRIVCEKFMFELKHPSTPPSGHTTLRLRWKASGWTYRKV